MDASYLFQVGIFEALSSSAAITSLLPAALPIYDFVPENAAMPYIFIGDDHITLGDDYQWSGTTDIYCNIHVFSRYRGKTELKKLSGAVIDTLSAGITLYSFQVLTFRYVDTVFRTENDGETQHAIIQFLFTVASPSGPVKEDPDPASDAWAGSLDLSDTNNGIYTLYFG